jgi:paraquat-inducible protein B
VFRTNTEELEPATEADAGPKLKFRLYRYQMAVQGVAPLRLECNLLQERRSRADVPLREAQRTLGSANSTLDEDSPLQQRLGQVLHELQRTAGSLRALTELLGRHPEALIRGRPTDLAPSLTTNPVLPAQRARMNVHSMDR